ncbi:hypothetical protein [Hymenobacter rubripertinctus]|uniref:hypothetical protein n=1 Tax=Hymenobacter rubripertinctus TaxID=2029981 RepID=UPI0011C4ABAD|nr:hypothetical protein [Hymenobacter rubripertinctus]
MRQNLSVKNMKYILDKLNDLGNEITIYPLKSEDLRKSYLELSFSTLELYYRQWCSIYSSIIIADKEVELTDEERKIIEVFVATKSDTTTFYSLRNSTNRNLLTESWSIFEFCLTYVCEQLFTDEIIHSLLEYDYKEIENILNKYNLNQSDSNKVKKIFSRGHLTHVPVSRKYNKIYSIYKNNHTGSITDDKLFLEFYGKYRNCMHTNYIYHGKSKEYSFFGTTYWFNDGEAVAHSKEPDITDMFNLALHLKDVCKRLFDSIEYTDLLRYPEEQVFQP